ncbi:GntR family transcriptional regulator [Ascidiaceihabitans sp.]|uniref:GntR family transcriptional regulator n=1 Tax=Ascidiaceihabitans sp. TaxID=1872644 RepID=UPI00329A67B5
MNDPESTGDDLSENLSSKIYSGLRMELIVGDLKPAAKLSIRKLAEKFGVSAMPVREALRQLATEHALIGAKKKAYRVPDLRSAEASNLFFVRAVLEGAAAEIAAQRVNNQDLEILERFANEMEIAWKKQDASSFLASNFRLHSHVYSLTGNHALQSMIESLYVRTGPWLAHGIVNLVNPDNWMGEHLEIIDALRRRDGAAARRLMEEDAEWGVHLYNRIG